MENISVLKPSEAPSPSARQVLASIFKNGPMARSNVTSLTDLSQQSVHRLIEQLHAEGFLEFHLPEVKGRGKPSPRVAIDPKTYASVGLSIGTEEIRSCVLDLAGRPIVEGVLDCDPNRPHDVMKALNEELSRWSHKETKERKLIGLGVSMQGFRRDANDVFFPPPKLSEWSSLPIEQSFKRALNMLVFTENNATCSAAAEYYLGVGAGQKDLAYLSFNFGFGVGFFFNGDSHIGARGNAGEITSIFLPEEKDRRPALGKLAERLNQDLDQAISNFDPQNPAVRQWLEDTRPQLRLALRAINAVADPGIIVFGGEAPEALRALLIEQAEGTFDAYRTPSPTLMTSKLRGDAAHLGAAFLPLHELVY